jgi:hypothetical protein
MSDRLKELQRQRALAQEQVAWFDREIAKEQGLTPAAPAPTATAPLAPVAPVVNAPLGPAPRSQAEIDRQAEEIITRFKPVQHPAKDARRGCILYFISAFVLLAFAVLAYYVLHLPQPE